MLASFSSQHLESHLHDPGNPLYDSITKNHALIQDIAFASLFESGDYAVPNTFVIGHLGLSFWHRALYLDGAVHSIDRSWKLH